MSVLQAIEAEAAAGARVVLLPELGTVAWEDRSGDYDTFRSQLSYAAKKHSVIIGAAIGVNQPDADHQVPSWMLSLVRAAAGLHFFGSYDRGFQLGHNAVPESRGVGSVWESNRLLLFLPDGRVAFDYFKRNRVPVIVCTSTTLFTTVSLASQPMLGCCF